MTGPGKAEPALPVQTHEVFSSILLLGSFHCLVVGVYRWKAWVGRPFGADGSHQTPEDTWAGGVSIPPRPKAKVLKVSGPGPINYIPLAFPSEKGAGQAEVA